MVEIIFNYEGRNIKIKSNAANKMKEIIDEFLKEISQQNKNDNNFCYIYNGNKIDFELTFLEQANDTDKKRKKMNILVVKFIDNQNDIKQKISKDIICPECKENILIDIKDFKINLHGCKHKHEQNNIFLYCYEETQKINLNNVICEICQKNNKNNTPENEFYICFTCMKNICPSCKTNHDISHIINNYDDRNYICTKHNKPFIKYCKECNKEICNKCEKKHKDHDILRYKKLLIDKEDLIKTSEKLKHIIDIWKFKINIIKEIFEKMNHVLDIYLKINNDIIDNYNTNQRNYYILNNISYLNKFNENLFKKLQNMIEEENISDIYKFSFDNFYNQYGEKYIGAIKNVFKEGKGILYYNKDDKKNRQRYVGDFKNDKRDGKGIIYWNDGTRYEGDWNEDIRNGKGKFYWKNGDNYEGDFINNKFEGKGIFNWKNGNRYEGEFKNNILEGKGIFNWKEGDTYEGEFKNGKREGKGIMHYKNGLVEDGNWKNDIFIIE